MSSMNLLGVWPLAACAAALDQMSKWIVLESVDLASTGPLVIVPGILTLALGWNTGVNFGLLSSESMVARWFLILLAVTVSLGLIWWIRHGAGRTMRWGVGLIVGGALGNAIDRVIHGAVVDFLNVSAPGIDNPFLFNVADVWIVLGAGLLMVSTARKPETLG